MKIGNRNLSDQTQTVQNSFDRQGDADRILHRLRYVGKILPLSPKKAAARLGNRLIDKLSAAVEAGLPQSSWPW